MTHLLAIAALTLNLGIGYDIKDGGSLLSGGKYDGLNDNWRYHGLIGLRSDMTDTFGIGYIHGSSLYDGLSGSPRDFDILYINMKFDLIK